MNRKDFLVSVGKGAAVFTLAHCLEFCGSNSNNPTIPAPPTNVDFTLDLSTTTYSALNTVGGYAYNQGLIIARTGNDSFAAVSAACTHQGSTLIYELGQNRFHCNSHGSNFSTDGNVINGPAAAPLAVYKTQLNGTNLHVFS